MQNECAKINSPVKSDMRTNTTLQLNVIGSPQRPRLEAHSYCSLLLIEDPWVGGLLVIFPENKAGFWPGRVSV